MNLSRSALLRFAFLALIISGGLVAACSINPQPTPPGSEFAPGSGDGTSDAAGGGTGPFDNDTDGAASAAVDSGTRYDDASVDAASPPADASSDAGPDASGDAGDAASEGGDASDSGFDAHD